MRTMFLGMCALLSLGAMLYFLRPVLLPLLLALALKHLLQPLIHALSVRPLICCGRTYLEHPLVKCSCDTGGIQRHGRFRKRLQAFCDSACRLQLPRSIAVIISLLVAFGFLGLLAAIVADSVHIFAERAEVYAAQVKVLLRQLLGWVEWFSCGWTPRGCAHLHNSTANATAGGGNATDPTAGDAIERVLSKIPITQIALGLVESLFEMCSNLFLVLLFTVYLLLPRSGKGDHDANDEEAAPPTTTLSEVDAQILAYIKGKVALSLIVGSTTALVLFAVGLDLWLVFGVLAFWLNFIPNVGAVVAVCLPMPLVVLDPDMSTVAMVLAFVLPFCVHMTVGNVLEPLIFGHSLELQPILILLSLMVWGSLWGITGMVLAVPITAVLKIYLSFLEHPAAEWLVRVIEGRPRREAGMAEVEPVYDVAHSHGGSFSSSCQSGALESATLPLVANNVPPAIQ